MGLGPPSPVRRGKPIKGRGSRLAAGTTRTAKAETVEPVGLVPVPARGPQEPGRGVSSIFFEALDVNLVNVEVFVTDRKGVPVTGLTADDFELLEDGRPVEISNFYAVDGGRPAESTPAPPTDEPVPDAPSPNRCSAVRSPCRRTSAST